MINNIKKHGFVTISRAIGNILNVLGYFVALNLNPLVGCSISILGKSLLYPFCFKYKMWDFLLVLGIFGIVDIYTIFGLLTK